MILILTLWGSMILQVIYDCMTNTLGNNNKLCTDFRKKGRYAHSHLKLFYEIQKINEAQENKLKESLSLLYHR